VTNTLAYYDTTGRKLGADLARLRHAEAGKERLEQAVEGMFSKVMACYGRL